MICQLTVWFFISSTDEYQCVLYSWLYNVCNKCTTSRRLVEFVHAMLSCDRSRGWLVLFCLVVTLPLQQEMNSSHSAGSCLLIQCDFRSGLFLVFFSLNYIIILLVLSRVQTLAAQGRHATTTCLGYLAPPTELTRPHARASADNQHFETLHGTKKT